MPHLRYGPFAWRVAGDEFCAPMLWFAMGRALWIALPLVLLILYAKPLNECASTIPALVYLCLSVLWSACLIILDTAMGLKSLHGTIIEVEKRSSIGLLLILRTIISACLVLNGAVLGVISISLPRSLPCRADQESTQVNKGILAFVIIAQCIEPAFFLCFASLCLVSPKKDIDQGILTVAEKQEAVNRGEINQDIEVHSIYSETVIDKWQQRLSTTSKVVRYACCNTLGGANISEGYDDVALVFSRLFHHNGFFDIVPSDIVAGFVLVRYEQLTHRRRVLQTLSQVITNTNARDPALSPSKIVAPIGAKASPQEHQRVRESSGEDEESKASGSVIRAAYDEMYKQSSAPNVDTANSPEPIAPKRRVSFSEHHQIFYDAKQDSNDSDYSGASVEDDDEQMQEELVVSPNKNNLEQLNNEQRPSVDLPELPEDVLGTGKKFAVLPQGILRDVITDFTDIDFDPILQEREAAAHENARVNSISSDVDQVKQRETEKVKIIVQQGQDPESTTEIDVSLLKSIAKMSLLASYLYSATISLPTSVPPPSDTSTAVSNGDTMITDHDHNTESSAWLPSWMCFGSKREQQSHKHWTEKNCCPGCDRCCDHLCYSITSGCGQQPQGGMRLFCGWWFGSKLEVEHRNRPKRYHNHHHYPFHLDKGHEEIREEEEDSSTTVNTMTPASMQASPSNNPFIPNKTTSPIATATERFNRARYHNSMDFMNNPHHKAIWMQNNEREEGREEYGTIATKDEKTNVVINHNRNAIIRDEPTQGDDEDKQRHKKRFAAENFHGINFIARDLTLISSWSELITGTELIYVSSQRQANDILHKPYAVFVDHKDRRVIIAIRGTMTLEDAVTDALCEPEEMSGWGARFGFHGDGRYAHSGMLRVAMTLRQELEEIGLLDFINEQYLLPTHTNDKTGRMTSRDSSGSSEVEPTKAYQLVVTGHSLGAGVAVLTAMALRPLYDIHHEEDIDPKVFCFAYGVPGATVDRQTSIDMQSYVTSIVLGSDVIPRTSFMSICKLRDDVLDAIARAKVSKATIVRSLLLSYDVSVGESDDIDSRHYLYDPGEAPDSQFKRDVEKFKKIVEPSLQELQRKELCVPGKIVHFVKTRSERSGGIFANKTSTYSMTYGKIEDFKEISISHTMILDHTPDRYCSKILNIVKNKLKLFF